MKKYLILAAAALLLINLPSARAAEAPGDLTVFEDERMAGAVVDALPLADGILVLGSSEYGDDGWMAYINGNGSARWLLEEGGAGVFSCPAALDGGSFFALVSRYAKYDYSGNLKGRDESLLVMVNGDGEITQTLPLPYRTEWLIPYAGGYFAIGTSYERLSTREDGAETALGMLTRLDGAGDTLWSYVYTHPSYSDMTFRKGAMAADSLILIGDGHHASQGSSVGLIHRVDLNGQVMWTSDAVLGSDTAISDVCVSPGGLIAGCYLDIKYDEEDDFPVERSGSVFCLDMDGEPLWEYMLENGLAADYILPLSGGFLCGSRGMDLESCPWLGDGWLLMLDEMGNAQASDGLPDISGGKLELMGMTKDPAGKLLLYGALLDEPGFPGGPFLTRLDLPAVK